MKNCSFTPEQKEMLKTSYVISYDYLYPVVCDIADEERGLTTENFKVYIFNKEGVQVLTIEDFSFYNPESGDYDYAYTEDMDYICHDEVPKVVAELLDAAIETRG